MRHLSRRHFLSLCLIAPSALVINAAEAAAQAVQARHWQGTMAVTSRPEQVVARTMPEWRSLWDRVGSAPPERFEPSHQNAIGIFLGRRASDGYSINIISASRRRDRIVILFEERMPADIRTAQRTNPAARSNSNVPALAGAGLGGPGAGFAAPGAAATMPPPPPGASVRRPGQPTSPWAIVVIYRADLPISVEQRLFR